MYEHIAARFKYLDFYIPTKNLDIFWVNGLEPRLFFRGARQAYPVLFFENNVGTV